MTTCPRCHAEIAADDQFCESCGATLVDTVVPMIAAEGATGTHLGHATPVEPGTPPDAAPQTCSCGGAIDDDGWCSVCGLRARNERDHFVEVAAPNVAAVCDRGLVHARNEDATALAAADDRIVVVVCDGVTSTTDSDVASLAAVRAARDALVSAPPPTTREPDDVVAAWTAAITAAASAAQAEAEHAAATVGSNDNPPSCTFVAAVVDAPVLVAGWLGDSRCYWFGDDGTGIQVSVDDSWATGQIAQGIPRDIAEADPRAHSITRWLGTDAPESVPTCASVDVQVGGWLLLCSDGLWNYCSSAADLGALLRDTAVAQSGDPLATADALCSWANDRGGHDNITVALARITGTAEPAR